MWVSLDQQQRAHGAMVDSAQAAPLQAFGNVHRALRENEKRLSSVTGELVEVESKIQRATRQQQQEGRRLRQDMSKEVADLEELVLQMYEEHEAALSASKSENEALRERLEAELGAHRAALVAQQGQIDALAAALRRQQEVMDEHLRCSTTQLDAVQAEAGELHRAFKAQGAAVQATKAFINSVDEKLTAQLEERMRVYEERLSATTAGWQSTSGSSLERFLAWEPQMRADAENLRLWRQSVDEKLTLHGKRAESAERDAESCRVGARAELEGMVDKCQALVKELQERWPEWVSELRAESTRQPRMRSNRRAWLASGKAVVMSRPPSRR